ncbi:unnamed protein product, partial [Ectocarpus sp. 8 AP-2014]
MCLLKDCPPSALHGQEWPARSLISRSSVNLFSVASGGKHPLPNDLHVLCGGQQDRTCMRGLQARSAKAACLSSVTSSRLALYHRPTYSRVLSCVFVCVLTSSSSVTPWSSTLVTIR